MKGGGACEVFLLIFLTIPDNSILFHRYHFISEQCLPEGAKIKICSVLLFMIRGVMFGEGKINPSFPFLIRFYKVFCLDLFLKLLLKLQSSFF